MHGLRRCPAGGDDLVGHQVALAVGAAGRAVRYSSASDMARVAVGLECSGGHVAMPILRAVSMTRQAISPRLAIRILVNMARFILLRGMLPCLRHGFSSSCPQHRQAAADALAGLVRLDHVVDEAARAGDEGLAKRALYSASAAASLARVTLVLAEDDLHRALGAHHGDLGVGPGEVDVAAQVLELITS